MKKASKKMVKKACLSTEPSCCCVDRLNRIESKVDKLLNTCNEDKQLATDSELKQAKKMIDMAMRAYKQPPISNLEFRLFVDKYKPIKHAEEVMEALEQEFN